MTINLKEDERLDDLQRNGYKLIQNTKIFCFGIDAVLLCSFTKVNEGDKVLDLCTGNGVIPILLKGRTKGSRFSGLEIQDINVDMAKRSVEYNGIGEFVDIVKGDVKEASGIFGGASFDVVTCNPPYMNENHGLKNPDSHKAIARHEILCTLEDVVREGAKVLKPGGRFNMVHSIIIDASKGFTPLLPASGYALSLVVSIAASLIIIAFCYWFAKITSKSQWLNFLLWGKAMP